jgi:Alr-MurF fusion protein
MNYQFHDIATILKGQLIAGGDPACAIRELVVDSRTMAHPHASLFFAIKGQRHNGHTFLRDCYDRGVRNFVVSENPEILSDFRDANVLLVDDSLKALQLLAAGHRSLFKLPVVGITGSNGKTIVKEWLFQLLSPDLRIVRSPKSYNSQVGVPLSVWQIKPEHELAIFEAGISQPDEMEKLQAILWPDIGIFTNIGAAHERHFINMAQKAGEKLKLFTRVEVLIYCSDYFEIQDRIIRSEIDRNIRLFTWSYKNKADLKISRVIKGQGQTEIIGHYQGHETSIVIPFTDDASVENAVHCWAFMLCRDYQHEVIRERMMGLIPVAMRLELKEGINHCSVINDSYNNDFNSLSIALDFLNQQKQHIHKTVILSDILQSAMEDDELYSRVAALLKEKGIHRIIGIGRAISHHAGKFDLEKDFFESTQAFLNKFPFSTFQNETILLKGARIFEFEQISRQLQQKSHDTVLEINLNAIVHNLNQYRSKLKPGTKIMAMVKAFSYGSGSFEIANMLQFQHIDYLAVAYADEGIELRKAGISTPVMVMSPEAQSIEAMISYGLEPEIYNMRILDLLLQAIHQGISSQQQVVPVHIKLDTGMHRLGFTEEALDDLLEVLKREKGIRVCSVFSHLAASSESRYDDFTRLQIETFRKMGARIRNICGDDVMMHILNSSGISRFPEAQMDMVRLGIGLYGIGYDDDEQRTLLQVGTLKSIITQIKTVKTGESVGYSREWIAAKDTRIAVIPVGYADGLDRRLGNGKGRVVIAGAEVPIIGNICMDMCMADLGQVQAAEGDEVILFSAQHSISQWAKELGTIPYEILTSIGGRVKRVYYYE